MSLANAQEVKSDTNAQKIKFGAKAGLNLSTVSVENNKGTDFGYTPGFHVGGLADFKIADKFSVQPELLFSTQGSSVKPSSTGDDKNAKYSFSYLNLPVMAKFYPIKGLSVEAGPQIGVLLSSKFKMGDAAEEDFKKHFTDIDFGLNFGLGYEFTEHLFAQARYNLGLYNIVKEKESADFKIYNRGFQFSVGYRF